MSDDKLEELATIKARWAAADYGLNEWGDPIGGEQAKADVDRLVMEVDRLREKNSQLEEFTLRQNTLTCSRCGAEDPWNCESCGALPPWNRYEQEAAKAAQLSQAKGDEMGEGETVGRLIWRDEVEIHGYQQPAAIEVMWRPEKTEIHVWSATGLSVDEGFDVARKLAQAVRFASLHPCCDLHNSHCEPPSELCCRRCSEADHPNHPVGVICVLDPAAPVRTP